ncbi:hypothetical protein RRG08_012582 [Elysia crispata]|uniref:HTH psq-type domain-containing protein n=1 Tax=Elysia crispata TaxID=231223 RepID=A0AAE1E213_9GAST|nr:hypothetical protein RRG08_012582 [Elysia crispata]
MVDCGSPRCAQWRRSFRRDLQLWGKKLPVVVGLERIAADYVDKETSELLLNPYPEWEKCMTSDFESAKKCFHCDKKLPNVYRRIQRIIDEAKRGKASNGKICLRSLQDLMPFCSDFYKNGFGHELFSDCVKEYFINVSTISTEPFQAHAHNQVPGAQPTVLTSHTERELSPRVWASAAQTGESEEGPSIQAGSPPSPSSSLSVLAPGDNNLNRLRVPNISSGRSQRKSERQLKHFEKHELHFVKKEDVFNVKRPWQSSSSNKRSSPCSMVYNHLKSQHSHNYHPYHNPKHNKLPFTVHHDDCSLHQKRLRSHQQNDHIEVVISDSEDEEANPFQRKRPDQLCDRHHKYQHQIQFKQQQKNKESEMSTLELFESTHRRLRLEQLEQLGHLGHLEHEQQQQLEGMCTAASASLFRLANQHILPPGVDHSAFSAAAAAAAVAHSSPALPFLLPILPCSLKLKLEPGDEDRGVRKEIGGREDYQRKDELFENAYGHRAVDHAPRHIYQNNSQISDLRPNHHDSFEILTQHCRLENLRRMHNLNAMVEQGEILEDNFNDHHKPWPSRAATNAPIDNDQHNFYQKELKLPLLTNLVRKLVHQKFDEITSKSRQDSQCETQIEKSPKVQQTHLHKLLLQQRKDESSAPYNPYLNTMPPHFVTAALASSDENIATPMYNYIMESIYTNMMKDDNSSAPKPFGKVHESGRVGEALKDIITKSISKKMQNTDSSLPDQQILRPTTSEPLPSGYAMAPLNKPEIWSPALSTGRSEIETKKTSLRNTISSVEDKDIVSPPPKRSKKESGSSRSKSEAAPSSSAVLSSDGSGNNNGKKTRPKRGQYRKYNSQLLMDAVKAVQRGEMSVHRAGSFYGVPHSTLEYKVKERHLLRQKKPREAGESSDSKTASEASSPPPPISSTSPRLSLKGSPKAGRSARTQSQDSSSSIDGESGVSESQAEPSSKRKHKKASITADSLSPRSSASSSTPPSPTATPVSSSIVSTPTLKVPVSCVASTSPPSSPTAPPSPLPAPPSPHAATKHEDKPFTGNSLSNSIAWFQPYLDVPPSMQQLLGSATCSSSTKSSSSNLDSLGHTNSASELLRKLQHQVQAKESGLASIRAGAFSPSSDSEGGTVELSCGQDRRAYDLHCQPHHQGSSGSTGPLQDRLMLYKQSA